MIAARIKEVDNSIFESRMSEVVRFPLYDHELVQHRCEEGMYIIVKTISQENRLVQ